MIPQVTAVAELVELSDTNIVHTCLDVLCLDVHRDFGEVHICADSCRGGNACALKHRAHHFLAHLGGGHFVCAEIVGEVDKNLVNRVNVNVLGGDKLKVNLVNLRAHLHIPLHSRRRDNIVNHHLGVAVNVVGKVARSAELFVFKPVFALGVGLFYPLYHLKKPCPAGDSVGFERRRNRKADGFFSAAFVGDDKEGVERIKSAVNALYRSIEGF